MASKYTELVTAVMAGNTVVLDAEEHSIPSIRSTLYRELQAARLEEKALGVRHYRKLQLSMINEDGQVTVALVPKQVVTFTILKGDNDGEA